MTDQIPTFVALRYVLWGYNAGSVVIDDVKEVVIAGPGTLPGDRIAPRGRSLRTFVTVCDAEISETQEATIELLVGNTSTRVGSMTMGTPKRCRKVQPTLNGCKLGHVLAGVLATVHASLSASEPTPEPTEDDGDPANATTVQIHGNLAHTKRGSMINTTDAADGSPAPEPEQKAASTRACRPPRRKGGRGKRHARTFVNPYGRLCFRMPDGDEVPVNLDTEARPEIPLGFKPVHDAPEGAGSAVVGFVQLTPRDLARVRR